jgi:hypothetical protein
LGCKKIFVARGVAVKMMTDETLFMLQLFEQQNEQSEQIRAEMRESMARLRADFRDEMEQQMLPRKTNQPTAAAADESSYLRLSDIELFDLHRMYGKLPADHPLVAIVEQATAGGTIDLQNTDLDVLNMVYRELLKKEKIDKIAEVEKAGLHDKFHVQYLTQEKTKLEFNLAETAAQRDKLLSSVEAYKIRLVELTPLVKQYDLLESFLKKTEDSMNQVIADMDGRIRKFRSMIQLITDTAYQVDLQELPLKHVAPRIVGIIKEQDHIAAMRNIVGQGQLLNSSASGMNLNKRSRE